MKIIRSNKCISFLIVVLTCLNVSCNKNDLLDTKPSTKLALPSSFQDFQAILDNQFDMNNTSGLGDVSSDNYYMTSTYFQTQNERNRNTYIWAPDIYVGLTSSSDWNLSYKQVFNANVVLEGLMNLKEIDPSEKQTWDNLKGSALFFRAYAFFNIAQLFAPMYDSSTASLDLGIPLRLNSDINAPTIRASLKQTYEQILSDLDLAQMLCSSVVPLNNKNRPSKVAVLALKARIYLSVRNYAKAGLYADSCLQLYSTLVDYNTLATSTVRYLPFNYLNNGEVFFNAYQYNANGIPSGAIINAFPFSNQIGVDTNLYRSYHLNDLRRTVFFYVNANGVVGINGSYAGLYQPFSGLATDEMYLVRAECQARVGNTGSAMNDLNTVLSKRWKTSTFVPYTATGSADAVSQIQIERRKELYFRSVRWGDLRRLNKEGRNIVLTRLINGQTITLPPNDPKYVFPIPPDVILMTGIQQNPR